MSYSIPINPPAPQMSNIRKEDINFTQFIKNNKTKKNTYIYIAIGSAHNIEQQIHPSFNNENSQISNSIFYIILFDSMLENIPLCLLDNTSEKNIQEKKYINYVKEDNIFKFTKNTNEYYLFHYNINIRYKFRDPFDIDNIDITDELEKLNKLAIKNNYFVLVTDYSGGNIDLLAYHFDESIGEHYNHIIYGFPSRLNILCLADFKLKHVQLAFINAMEIFNPQKLLYMSGDEIINYIVNLEDEPRSDTSKIPNKLGVLSENLEINKNLEIIREQIKEFYKHKYENFKNTLNLYRRVYMKKIGHNLELSNYEFCYINCRYHQNLDSKTNNLFDIIDEFFKRELLELLRLINMEDNYDDIIYDIEHEKDSYKKSNIMINYIKHHF
jgi:hypothetical protein